MTFNQGLGTAASSAESQLKEFATNLVKQKKFENLDQEIFDMLVSDVYDRLEERVNAVMLANIPGNKVEEFEQILSSGNKEAIADYTVKNIPHLQKILTESLLEFQKTYLGIQ